MLASIAEDFGVTEGYVWDLGRNRKRRDPDYRPPPPRGRPRPPRHTEASILRVLTQAPARTKEIHYRVVNDYGSVAHETVCRALARLRGRGLVERVSLGVWRLSARS
jgi:transposase